MLVKTNALGSGEFTLPMFAANGSACSLQGLLSADAEAQDLMAQQLGLGPALVAPDAGESSAAVEPSAGAALRPTFPRVASLDFIRAFLSARHNGSPGGAPMVPAPGWPASPFASLPQLPAIPGGEQQQLDLQQLELQQLGKAEPASSASNTTDTAGPAIPAAPSPALALSEAAMAGALPIPGAALPPDALAAALLHSSTAGSALVPVPVPVGAIAAQQLALPMVPAAAPEQSGSAGRRGSTVVVHAKQPAGAPRGKAGAGGKGGASAVNPAGLSKAELRRVRRMVSNRESARRSRKRKAEQLSEMDGRLREAQAELDDALAKASRLSDELSQRDWEIAALKQELAEVRGMLKS